MLGYAYTRTRTDKTAYQMDFMSSYEGILYFQDSFKYFRRALLVQHYLILSKVPSKVLSKVPSKIDTSVLDTVRVHVLYLTKVRKYLVLSYFRAYTYNNDKRLALILYIILSFTIPPHLNLSGFNCFPFDPLRK